MKNRRKRESTWEWYAVKLLYESIIVGEPNPEKIDANYSNQSNQFKASEENVSI